MGPLLVRETFEEEEYITSSGFEKKYDDDWCFTGKQEPGTDVYRWEFVR